ncbi:MAG: hypothetical protein RMI79_06835 [Nitrososphaerota archaeon]|nr:hypothetical protein [Nitrososphaerota archaeon]
MEFGAKDGFPEYRKEIPYEYDNNDRLFVETPESCIVSFISECSFLDAFTVLCLEEARPH